MSQPTTLQITSRVLTLGALCFLSLQDVRPASADTKTAHEHEKKAMQYKADNTGRNARDVNPARPTADDQKLSEADRNLLANVRKEIVANDSLSTNAKNVKILVEGQSLVLRGPVNSAQEKSWIETAAAKVAAGHSINNQLEVVSN